MADNDESIAYSYTGDVSSLKKATNGALGLLNQFQAHMDRIANAGGFGKSAKAVKSFQAQVKAATSQMTKVQGQMKGVSDVKLYPSSAVTKQFQGALSSYNNVLTRLKDSTSLTTKQVQSMTAQLRSTTAELRNNSAGVQDLVQKEQKWQQTLNIVRERTSQLRTNLDSMRNGVNNAFNPMLAKLQSLTAPFTGVVTRMQSFKDKASESFGKVRQLADTVASAFRRVKSAEDDSANSSERATTAHNRLGKVLSSLQKFFKSTTSAVTSLGRSIRSGLSKLSTFNAHLNTTSRSARSATTALRALIAIPISRWLVQAVKQSIGYIESLNLFTVAMGDAVDEGLAFVNQMAEIYGMDPKNLLTYAGNFYQLSDAVGTSSDAAKNMSLGLTKAINDISSLFNIPIQQVFENLSSGMQGMSRAVRKYGIDIRAVTLQQTALSLGISESVETMNEANLQGLRFITMMRQARNASGDFARTIESPANQLKIFKEQITQLGRAIGNFLIKPISTAIVYLNGFIMAIRTVLQFLGTLFGFVNSTFSSDTSEQVDEVATSVSGIGSAAASSAKKLQKLIAPFDELNILSEQSAGAGGGGGGIELGTMDPAILQAIEEMQWKLEDIEMKANKVRNAILEFLGFEVKAGTILSWDASAFEQNLIEKWPQWTKTIQATFDNWSNIVNAFKNVLNSLGGVAQTVWNKVVGYFNNIVSDDAVADYIGSLSGTLNKFAKFLSKNQDKIADFAIAVGSIFVAFKGFTRIKSLIAPIQSFISICSSALAPFASTVAAIAAIIAAVVLLYENSTAFATAFDGLFNSLVEGFGSIFETMWVALQEIWEGILVLWEENIQPMLASIGDALAPVIETVSSLWTSLSEIIVGTLQTVTTIWNEVLEPVLAAFFDAVSALADLFGTLWSEFIGPVVEHIGKGLSDLWNTTLMPIAENVMAIIGGIAEIILWLWNSVLAPVLNWVADVFGPLFTNVFNSIWDFIQNVVEGIGQSLNGILEVCRGIIDFITGVFSGDWERAWNGVIGIFSGIWETIEGIVKLAMNAVITVINGILGGISGGINAVIRAVNKISVKIPKWVPGIGGEKLGFDIKEVGTWSIPYLAAGGVVTSPTVAMVGEGKYDEAVLPLGNSPQMKDLVNQIANAVKDRGSNEPTQINVYIGDEQVAEYMYRVEKRAQLQTNGGA